MKFVFLLGLALILSHAQYKKTAIDTHGGKSDALFDKKNSFSKTNGLSLNSSLQKKTPLKKPKTKASKTKIKK